MKRTSTSFRSPSTDVPVTGTDSHHRAWTGHVWTGHVWEVMRSPQGRMKPGRGGQAPGDFSRRPGPALLRSGLRKDWKEVWEQAKGLTGEGPRDPGRGKNQCKGPKAGIGLPGVGSSQQARAAGEEPGGGAAEGAVGGKGGPG